MTRNSAAAASKKRGANGPPQVDYLSFLPSGVLTAIFEHANDPIGRSPSGAISRRLLTYTNAKLYRAVRLGNYHDIALFCRTATSNPDLARLVQDLTLCVSKDTYGACSKKSKRPGKTSPTRLMIFELFNALGELRDLEIHASSMFAMVMLERESPIMMPKLSNLTLHHVFGTFKDPFAYHIFRNLNQYTCLQKFTYYHGLSVDSLAEPGTGEKYPCNHSLRSLALLGQISSRECALLLSRFHELNHVELLDWTIGYPPNVGELVNCIATKENQLESLVLRQQVAGGLTVDKCLDRFKGLQKITLYEHTFTPDLFNCLNQDSPLEILEVQWCSAVTFQALVRLISGRKKLQNLTHITFLVLDVIQGRPLTPYRLNKPKGLGWTLPNWRDTFTFANAKTLIEVATRSAVTISENLQDAIRVQEEWERQTEEILRLKKYENKAMKEMMGKFKVGTGI